jgi:hypothetical protein
VPRTSKLSRSKAVFGALSLCEYWDGKSLSKVNAGTCAGYVKHRGHPGGARRDLETLRAAINHHGKRAFTAEWFVSRFRERARRAIVG